jgi:elongation factor P
MGLILLIRKNRKNQCKSAQSVFSVFYFLRNMATTVNNIKKKNVIDYKGDMCLVLESVIRTPPNLRAFAQMTLKSLKTGKKINVRCNTGESFEVLKNDFKSLEYSYEDKGMYVFMDPETYETHELSRELLEDVVDFLVPNRVYEVMLVEDQPIIVNLPGSIVMKVTQAAEGVKGDSATNVQKPVTLETGITVNVPLFIKAGELIRINTEDRSYMGRA